MLDFIELFMENCWDYLRYFEVLEEAVSKLIFLKDFLIFGSDRYVCR
jgi:hypothetical protein